ncbi:MAG: hypothetical protein KJ792_12095 [Actinobacteria bacterium]|nr:hypothetical protein [Actinomycetota bacterium]MCG2802051.1 hypothetical protein [Cellulomonas sp.]
MTLPAAVRVRPAPAHRRAATLAIGAGLTALLLGGCTGSPQPEPGATSSRPAPGSVGSPVGTDAASAGTGTASTPASESLPGFTAPTSLPGLAPAGTSGSTLSGTAPADATAQGTLVTGFPSQVVPVPDGVEVVSSSVSGQGTHLQATLLGSSRSAPAEVQAAYADALARAGFAGYPAATADGSSAVSYSRGSDGIVVSVRDRLGGGTELSVLATLTVTG